MKQSFKASNLLNTLYCLVSLLFLCKNFFFVTKCKINKQNLEVAHPLSGSSSTSFLVGWFLNREKNQRTRRKTSRSKGENQQQTQPTCSVDTRTGTRATLVGGECSHHCDTLAPHQCGNMFLSISQFFSISIIACRTCLIFQDDRSEEIEPYN